MHIDEFKESLVNPTRDGFYDFDWTLVLTQLETITASEDLAALFHTEWTTHGEKIREQVDDDARLARVLRRWLPPYAGGAVTLYRGESAARLESGRVGLCWTPLRRVAEMYGSGLNATGPGGGVLLRVDAPAAAVIAGPGRHSKYLDEEEYTVDPTKLERLEVIDRYPAIED